MMFGTNSIRRLGLDPSFAVEGFEQLAARAICPICRDYLEDAVETDCPSRHVFCRPCIQEALNRHQPCPTCRGHVSKIEPAHVTLRDILAHMKWKCVNFESGCGFKGTKTELVKHLDEECPEQETPCPLKGCTFKNRRALVVEHKAVCPYRITPCEYCRKGFPFHSLPAHRSVCLAVPIPCPNNCGVEMRRGDVGRHTQTDCPEQLVYCEVTGCEVQAKRKDMETHEKADMLKHIRLMNARQNTTTETYRIRFPGFLGPVPPVWKSRPFNFQGYNFVLNVEEGRLRGTKNISLIRDPSNLHPGDVSFVLSVEATDLHTKGTVSTRPRHALFIAWQSERLRSAAQKTWGTLYFRLCLSAPSSFCKPVLVDGSSTQPGIQPDNPLAGHAHPPSVPLSPPSPVIPPLAGLLMGLNFTADSFDGQ